MKTDLEFSLSPFNTMACRAFIVRGLLSIFAVLALSVCFGTPAQVPAADGEKAAIDAAANQEYQAATQIAGKGDPGSLRAAIDRFTKAFELASKSGNLQLQANAIFFRGVCHVNLGQHPDAIADIKKALESYTALKDPTGQFICSGFISALYLRNNEDDKARPYMELAWEQIKDGSFEKIDKSVVKMLGMSYFNLLGDRFVRARDRKRGLDFLWRSYELTADGPESERIDALLKYGEANVILETPKFAASFYETALKRARFSKLRDREGKVLLAMGELDLMGLDDPIGARQKLAEALAIGEEIKDEQLIFAASLRLGDSMVAGVDLSKALEFYQRSYEIANRAQIPAGDKGLVLFKISQIERFLGDTKKGAENEEVALQLARAGNHRGLQAQIIGTRALRMMNEGLNDPSLTGERSKELAKRIVEDLQAAAILVKDEPGGRQTAIGWMSDIARVMAATGQSEQALQLLSSTLGTVRGLGFATQEAMILSDLGALRMFRGEYISAVDNLNAALTIFRSIGYRGREARTMELLMSAWSKAGNRSLAVFFGKSAINLYQDIRRSGSTLSREQQNAFAQNFESGYRLLAKLLIEDGRLAEAEKVLTMLKEEELIEYVRRDDKLAKQLLETMAISEEERAAMLRYNELAEKITAIGKEFNDLEVERKQYASGEFPKQARYDELKQQLSDATVAFEKFLEDLKLKFGKNDTRVAQVDSSLKKTLERLKADRTAVVSTIVGDDTLNIIVTTSRTQRAHAIKKSAKEINELVAKLRRALTSPQYDPRPVSQELYDLIVKPIEGDLAGIKADTIVWSLDGTLRYIPPAALWDKKKGYLVERFSNVIVNLASRDTLALPVPRGQRLSVLGVGVSKPTDGFAPLAAVPDELDCIVTDRAAGVLSLKPQCRSGVLNGRKLLDEKFTLANFEGELGRYPIVHIASHFKLTPGDDRNSFLLLGGGGDRRYTVDMLRNESLTDVELIVLSACNTATPGGVKTNGVEIEGFASIAQREGAKAVMATLWPVADTSTKDFMVEFYRLYGKEGRSKADAVQLAQMKLLNGSYKATEIDRSRADAFSESGSAELPKYTPDPKAPFAHPYFWSPFILIGNWR